MKKLLVILLSCIFYLNGYSQKIYFCNYPYQADKKVYVAKYPYRK